MLIIGGSSPEEPRRVAGHFDQMQSQYYEMIYSPQGDVSTSEGGWEDMAQTKFDSVWPSYKNHMTDLCRLLQQISQELKQTAQTLEEADRQAASGIQAG